jgi:hypothetical protein
VIHRLYFAEFIPAKPPSIGSFCDAEKLEYDTPPNSTLKNPPIPVRCTQADMIAYRTRLFPGIRAR